MMDSSSSSASCSISSDSDIKKAKKRPRSVNFTTNECNTIVNLVMKYQHIIENRRSDAATWRAKEVTWDKIREEFNKMVGNEVRTTQSIRCKYETLKKTAKKERLLSGDVRPTVPLEIREKIRILQESTYDVPVNENSIELILKNDSPVELVTEIKKEADEATVESSGVDTCTADSEINQYSEDEEEDDINKDSSFQKNFVEEEREMRKQEHNFVEEERQMRKKEHDMKIEVLRLKTENQLKETQEHDLRIQLLKLDVEIKKRQLKLFDLREAAEIIKL